MWTTLKFATLFLAIIPYFSPVTSTPISTPNTIKNKEIKDANMGQIFKKVIKKLEEKKPKAEILIPRDDEDESPGLSAAQVSAGFDGVLNILFGAITGDLRRVIEDGAFNFIGDKDSKQNVLTIFHNLLGRTTLATTTKKPDSTTAAPTKKMAATTEPDYIDPEDKEKEVTAKPAESASTKKPPIKYHSGNKNSGGLTLGSKQNAVTVKSTTVATSSGKGDEDEEDSELLAARFEDALRPFIPKNMNDMSQFNQEKMSIFI